MEQNKNRTQEVWSKREQSGWEKVQIQTIGTERFPLIQVCEPTPELETI